MRRLRQRIASFCFLPDALFASVVLPAFGIDAELGDRGDVDHVVDPTVPGPRQPLAVLLTRGRVERCGPGPGCEAVAVGEPGDVADIGRDPRCDDGTDAVGLHQP